MVKKFNTAAIYKKYKYIAEIEDYMQQQDISDTVISVNRNLPKIFTDISKKFSGSSLPQQEHFIDSCNQYS